MSQSNQPAGFIERQFKVKQLGSSVSREIVAGCTTFAAMAYILVVNPLILADAGMPQAALVTATAVGAAIATLLMAFMANFPLALAPGMGINAFFAYTVCLGMGVPWQSALALVFVNGVIFLLLSITGVRQKVVDALPNSLKAAICAGIGLFIAFIGLQKGGLVVANPATMVSMGDLTHPPVALFATGILITCIVVARKTPGAVILSMGIITLIGFFIPNGKGGMVTSLPSSWVSLPASMSETFLALDFNFLLKEPIKALPVVLTLLLVDMFDNIGTLIGVTKRAGLMEKNGRIPRLSKALTADSLAAIISSILGTSTVVSYIESATGVQAGGRTGLTAVVTAILLLLALFFTPIILMIPGLAVAPALVIVGILMFEAVSEIELKHFSIAAPAVLTLLTMPMTFSISTGIGIGLISLTAISLGLAIGSKGRRAGAGSTIQSPPLGQTPFSYVLAFIFLVHFIENWLFGLSR
jgi:AGZA family xanthine/uracil permease-like MFS transporter